MKLILGSRKSDLAVIQAESVAKVLQKKSDLKIDFFQRPSMGDLNLDLDLSQTQSKGVFTADFLEHLKQGDCDLVVHSWKDLPIESHSGYTLVGGPYREDQRDVLFLKKTSYQKKSLKVLTSSPRREFQVKEHLPELLNFPTDLSFESIRGNIPTRFKKFLDSDADVYLVAKAAIDRLMSASSYKYQQIQKEIQNVFNHCHWMVLPLSCFPSAAAQGALALELPKDSKHLKFIRSCENKEVTKAVELERQKHKAFGGGCHLAMGFSVLNLKQGQILFSQGSHEGQRFYQNEFKPYKKWAGSVTKDEVFFSSYLEAKREDLETNIDLNSPAEYLVSKKSAIKSKNQNLSYDQCQQGRLFAAGVKTWKHLAQKGFWVNGCLDSLGQEHRPNFSFLPQYNKYWLSHLDASEQNLAEFKKVSMYKVTYKPSLKEIENKKVFYWSSGSAFLAYYDLFPEVLSQGEHFCGLGRSAEALLKHLPEEKVYYAYNEEDFCKQIGLKTKQ